MSDSVVLKGGGETRHPSRVKNLIGTTIRLARSDSESLVELGAAKVPARVHRRIVGHFGGVPVYGDPEVRGLPDPEINTVLVVSREVLDLLHQQGSDRRDVYAPFGLEYEVDQKGRKSVHAAQGLVAR
jgi:hypothetical protein